MKQEPTKIKVGIIGAAGYTGGELLRLLVLHPYAEIMYAQSNSQDGKAVSAVHTDLLGETDLIFTSKFHFELDVLFLCVGHGLSREFMETWSPPNSLKVIDLSADYRADSSGKWIYGLPELHRDEIQSRMYNIANPGCFATCIQLALLPLAESGLLKNAVHISATTGSTGAGQAMQATTQFSWRSNNLSSYKPFEHQHLAEINASLRKLQSGFNQELNFIPHRGSFTRGIFSSIYTEADISGKDATDQFLNYYTSHPFVKLSTDVIDLKQVVNTNKCVVHLEKKGTKLYISSVLDNLLKGASGQAVQNMNLLFGFEETSGLKLKASAF